MDCENDIFLAICLLFGTLGLVKFVGVGFYGIKKIG
jgi:hypothetical protein